MAPTYKQTQPVLRATHFKKDAECYPLLSVIDQLVKISLFKLFSLMQLFSGLSSGNGPSPIHLTCGNCFFCTEVHVCIYLFFVYFESNRQIYLLSSK